MGRTHRPRGIPALLASGHADRQPLPRPRRPRLRRHLTGGARGARGGLLGPDQLRLRRAAPRRGDRTAQGPPLPPGQRSVAGAERHHLRDVQRLVAEGAALARG
ncbi:hypothetical protein [Ornithinimicrobium kibberense]|uniref:hypothetical protein n=1 Tax=Ornithinimicrobium kibberense TaxID=282060 RepID=UPI0036078981